MNCPIEDFESCRAHFHTRFVAKVALVTAIAPEIRGPANTLVSAGVTANTLPQANESCGHPTSLLFEQALRDGEQAAHRFMKLQPDSVILYVYPIDPDHARNEVAISSNPPLGMLHNRYS